MVTAAYICAAVTFILALISGAIWFAGCLITWAMSARHSGDSVELLRLLGLFLLALAPLLTLAGARRLLRETRAQVRALRRATPAAGD